MGRFNGPRLTAFLRSGPAVFLLAVYLCVAWAVLQFAPPVYVHASSLGSLSFQTLHANDVTVNATGTNYTLTATDAAVTFGTTSPNLTIAAPGTWQIIASMRYDNSGATYAADRVIAGQIERTNNTPANIGASGMNVHTGVVTTDSHTAGFGTTTVFYTTANSNDALALFASVAVLPTAGSTVVGLAKITAIRLY